LPVLFTSKSVGVSFSDHRSSKNIHQEDVMRIVSKLLFLLSLTIIAACSQSSVGTLEIKVTGLPNGTNPNITVTGSGGFNQAVALSGTTTISDLPVGAYTVVAKNATVSGTTYASTVTGSPANVSGGATSSVSVVYGALRTITGKVVNGAGQPLTATSLSGAILNVQLLGSTTKLAPDATGNFTMPDVPATYSLAVLISSQFGKSATVYQDLTRADPTLTILQGQFGGSSSPAPTSSASVEGKITGGSGFNANSSVTTSLLLALPKAVSLFFSGGISFVDPVTGGYSTGTSWLGNSSVAATLNALQFSTDINGKITAYSGYGQQAVTLTPQGPISVPDVGQPIPIPTTIKQDVALAAISAGNVNGVITWPTAVTDSQYATLTTLLFPGSNQSKLDLFKANGATPNLTTAPAGYEQLVPLITGAKFIQMASINEKSNGGFLGALAKSAVWKLVTPGIASNLVVPAPIGLTTPANGANQISRNASFSWSTYSGGVHILSIAGPVQTQSQNQVQVVTTKSSTTIPDLGTDFAWVKDSNYGWRVEAVGPYSSIDAATDTSGLILPLSNGGSGPPVLSDASYAGSAVRLFTTAP
jgi:hypothetical protein